MGNILTEMQSAFTGKTVLITGHTGFKGSWLALWLYRLGAKVVGYALDPKEENAIFLCAAVDKLVQDHRGDIRDLSTLMTVFQRDAPEFVFHLAAQPLVREGYREPKETLDVNIGGTVNVLEACRKTPSVRAVVVITSDKCYLNNGKAMSYREEDRLGGYEPYGASKACAEIISHAYRQSFFMENTAGGRELGFATARAGNVIGGGDWAVDRIVPDCMRALRNGRPVILRNPSYTRPWQHVLEPLAGYMQLAANLRAQPGCYSGAWNFGPPIGATVPVKSLVEKIIKAYGNGSYKVEKHLKQPEESHVLALSASKAIRKLGWRPRLTLDQAVRMTVEWYKANEQGNDMRKISLCQINEYGKRAKK